jgi:hypothetical protein
MLHVSCADKGNLGQDGLRGQLSLSALKRLKQLATELETSHRPRVGGRVLDRAANVAVLSKADACIVSRAFHANVESHHCLSRLREPPFRRARNTVNEPPRATTARWEPKARFRRLIMKAIVSALLALTVLTGVAVAPASAAWDTKAFWDNLERTQGGGGN